MIKYTIFGVVRKLLISLLIGTVCLCSAVALSLVAYSGRVAYGVKVSGIQIGGNYRDKALLIIKQEIEQNREVEFLYQTRKWQTNTSKWKLAIDYEATIDEALAVGRNGSLVENLRNKWMVFKNGFWIDPIAEWDSTEINASIEELAAEIEIPIMNPQIEVDKNKNIVINPGKNGVLIDRNLLTARIKNSLFGKGRAVIEIPAEEIKPALSESQAQETKKKAEKLLGKSLSVINPETKQVWTLNDQQIIFWVDPSGGNWKNSEIMSWLEELAPSVNRTAQNASFTFVSSNKLEEFKPEIWGRALNTPGSFENLILALNDLYEGKNKATAELVLIKIAPSVTLGQVSNLGLVERIGIGESWFSGSITNRIFNLKKSATELNGVIVAPGEVFSFNSQIGEISANTGYKQAYVIKEGKTVLGDGGGVCQVSSTLFRAVLAAGLPIVERFPHAYRVHYYEEKYQPGFDATVFQPSPDFKFKNDTPAHLLIQMVYDEKAKYLAFEIFGTSDGRKAEISKARIWDQTPPPPDLYIDDPNLPLGRVVQTEHPAWGAKVAFDYKVVRGDEVLQDRTFVSVYRPWQAVYLRGTKI